MFGITQLLFKMYFLRKQDNYYWKSNLETNWSSMK
jgi:hypothetical protein